MQHNAFAFEAVEPACAVGMSVVSHAFSSAFMSSSLRSLLLAFRGDGYG